MACGYGACFGCAVPLRDESAEQRLIHQLRDELNLAPGRRATVQGPELGLYRPLTIFLFAVLFGLFITQLHEGVPGDQTATLPVWILPGHPDNAITVHMGWGRDIVGVMAVVQRPLASVHRLHDRLRYTRHGDAWTRERLAP